MLYRINVLLNGKQLFAIQPQEISDDISLSVLVDILNSKFPLKEGFDLAITAIGVRDISMDRTELIDALHVEGPSAIAAILQAEGEEEAVKEPEIFNPFQQFRNQKELYSPQEYLKLINNENENDFLECVMVVYAYSDDLIIYHVADEDGWQYRSGKVVKGPFVFFNGEQCFESTSLYPLEALTYKYFYEKRSASL